MKVPFNSPVILPSTMERLSEAIANKNLTGLGPFSRQVEEQLRTLTGQPNLLVTSASHALELMALLAEIKLGDEVIMPSFTFVSTANAFILRGAQIRFADNDEFGNIRISEVQRLLTPKTKAVVAVHYAGNSTDMNVLVEICKTAGVYLFEDAAQAIGSTFKGRALGTFGDLGCFSFHETKNVGSGEGGALIVPSHHPEWLERAEIIREKGTNRKNFLKGLVDKYTWVDIGSSYVLSDLNAAFLQPQLEKLREINSRRLSIQKIYREALEKPISRLQARVLETPAHNDNPNGHIFALVFQNQELRNSFIAWMSKLQISCPFHYVSLHSSPMGRKHLGPFFEELPGCDQISQGLVRLPLFFNMTDEQVEFVITSALQWIQQQ
jgi:dTDP-4-amino-4,6-dideoxygalactose transaminase